MHSQSIMREINYQIGLVLKKFFGKFFGSNSTWRPLLVGDRQDHKILAVLTAKVECFENIIYCESHCLDLKDLKECFREIG